MGDTAKINIGATSVDLPVLIERHNALARRLALATGTRAS